MRHGIVVDDPVSSLDHARMEAVAKRLVKEAKADRQVIIFTHNLFFHHAVFEEAKDMKVPRGRMDCQGMVTDASALSMTASNREFR